MKFDTILKAPQRNLKKILGNYLTSCGYTNIIKEDGFLYAEGNTPVLLVAHMDTVHHNSVKDICYTSDNNIIMSPQGIGGDDRCGIYAIVEIIKTAKCHVLFTEDEEFGCVGAKKFRESGLKPKVNFIIEIDRANSNDAVYYDCDNKEFENFISDFGFQTEYGSFTDISTVAPYLNVAAVNLSSGYYNPHTQAEYIVMSELDYNIERIKKIIGDSSHKYVYMPKSNYYDYRDNDIFNRYSRIYANNICENAGYVKYKGKILYDDDLYMGEDGKVYREHIWASTCLESAEARTCDDDLLTFSQNAYVYELMIR